MNDDKRRGLLPTVTQQALLTWLYAERVHRKAEQQAATGVHPYYAASHANRATAAVFRWWIGCLPVTVMTVTLSVWLGSAVLLMFWAIPCIALCLWIGARVLELDQRRGDLDAVYRLPTVDLVTIWLLWVFLGALIVGFFALAVWALTFNHGKV